MKINCLTLNILTISVSAQSSQTVTIDGSSFESASSMYSLARGEAISDDGPLPEDIPLPPIPIKKPIEPTSPANSTSSSGSYSLKDLQRAKTSPSRASLPKIKPIHKAKTQSMSDEEKSEKRYSSSGYYESPHEEDGDEKPVRVRRSRDWTEDERKRKKGNFKLEFEKDGNKTATITSPVLKPGTGFKQISPDDRTAMNILDGTSPSKGRRLRPKTKRSPRNRSTSGDDGVPLRRSKTPIVKSPEQPCAVQQSTKISPSKYPKKPRSPVCTSRHHKEIASEKRLKALSTESLRSVSPGSDSVFYSEADAISDHQVHCHHCGKEVEIVTANDGSQDSIVTGVVEEASIVQPPAGFADSPNGVRPVHTTRLYKKLDKRFRSEERHADRRHFKNRHDTRAKVHILVFSEF